MAHPNEELARNASDALAKGDIQSFLGFHADDVVLHLPGRGQLAGDHRGKDAVAKMFQQQMEILDQPPQLEVHDVLANDDHIVVLSTQTFQRGGKKLVAPSAVVIHPENGKAKEIWIHPQDQHAADEFWS